VALAHGDAASDRRPNILLAIADDWGYPHASCYGDPVVKTPTFDRMAREGVLFTNAFVSSPSCTPSRGALLAGQHFWRLREGADLWVTLPADIPTYPDLLEKAGYFVGHTRKGWGPGKLGDRTRNPAGPQFNDFEQFLAQRPKDKPFCFWFGSIDPHRPYEPGSGKGSGIDLGKIKLPAALPDAEETRSDVADYYFEVQRFDREAGGFDIELTAELDTGSGAHTIVRTNVAELFWTLAQMVAHQASGGAPLEAGDLIATGTVSGAADEARACLVEITKLGQEPLTLPDGTRRVMLEDGDTLTLRGKARADGFVTVGFGPCSGTVSPAKVAV